MATTDPNIVSATRSVPTVTDLMRHLSRLKPENNPKILALFNYLRYFCEPSNEFTANLLNRFFRRSLFYADWRNQQAQFMNDISQVIHDFAKAYRFPLDLSEILAADAIQVVPIESMATMTKFLHRWIGEQLSSGHQHQIVPLDPERIVAIVLAPDGQIRVIVQPLVLGLIDGILEPLFDHWTLNYSADLQLTTAPGVVHEIDCGHDTTARLTCHPGGIVSGFAVHGPFFQKSETFANGPLLQFPTLFYPIKRLEQLFIDRRTDQIYIDLVNVLEKAVELIDQGNREGISYGQTAYKRGKLALDMIYTDDRLLRALVSNLERCLVQRD